MAQVKAEDWSYMIADFCFEELAKIYKIDKKRHFGDEYKAMGPKRQIKPHEIRKRLREKKSEF